MSKKIIAANWKQNPVTMQQAEQLFSAYISLEERFPEQQLWVFPPSPCLSAFQPQSNQLKLGAQDISAYDKGAHTAQLGGGFIKSLGAHLALIGHSETRKELTLSNLDIQAKVRQAVSFGLRPVICVGYQEAVEIESVSWEELENQLISSLDFACDWGSVDHSLFPVIAYEPVWAIGSNQAASLDHIESVHLFIKQKLATALGAAAGENILVLYGGSVNEQNIASLADSTLIDGFLVGGASLVPSKLEDMIIQLEQPVISNKTVAVLGQH